MTGNSKQCINYEMVVKFRDKFNDPFDKKMDKLDLSSWGSPNTSKRYDKAYDANEKKMLKALAKFIFKMGIKECYNTHSLIRIYIRKMTYLKEGKKYQKLEPFGWYCEECKNIEIEPAIIHMKFPFHSSWSVRDLDQQKKERTKK